MTLMQRRRALMSAAKGELPVSLVNGTYESTVTVTNGNTVDSNPLPQQIYVTIPLTRPVVANETIAMMTTSILVKTIYWYVTIEGVGNIQINSTTKPSANMWYEKTQSGTITAIVLRTSEVNYIKTAEFSLKIDGEVIF